MASPLYRRAVQNMQLYHHPCLCNSEGYIQSPIVGEAAVEAMTMGEKGNFWPLWPADCTERNPVECSAVQYGIVQCSEVQINKVKFSAVQCNTVKAVTMGEKANYWALWPALTPLQCRTQYYRQCNI